MKELTVSFLQILFQLSWEQCNKSWLSSNQAWTVTESLQAKQVWVCCLFGFFFILSKLFVGQLLQHLECMLCQVCFAVHLVESILPCTNMTLWKIKSQLANYWAWWRLVSLLLRFKRSRKQTRYQIKLGIFQTKDSTFAWMILHSRAETAICY